MIINEVQGQYLKEVGFDTREECFSHMWLSQKLVLQKLTYTGSQRKNNEFSS
jgi:hypothetical protein